MGHPRPWLAFAVSLPVAFAASFAAHGTASVAYAETHAPPPGARRLDEAVSVSASDDACVTRAALLEHTRGWLGRDVLPAELGILVEVTPGNATLVVLRRGERVAQRRFERLPARCEDRRAVIGLAIALAVDATLLGEIVPTGAAPAAEEHSTSPTRETAPTAALPAATTVPSRSITQTLVAEPVDAPDGGPPDDDVSPQGWVLGLGLEGGILVGLLKGRAPLAASLRVEASYGPFRARAGLFTSLPEPLPVGRGTAETSITTGEALGCFARTLGLVGLDACVGASVGILAASGQGFSSARDATVPFMGLLARLEGRLFAEPWLGLTLGCSVHAPVIVPQLQVLDTAGDLVASSTLAPFGAALMLGAIATTE